MIADLMAMGDHFGYLPFNRAAMPAMTGVDMDVPTIKYVHIQQQQQQQQQQHNEGVKGGVGFGVFWGKGREGGGVCRKNGGRREEGAGTHRSGTRA